jgi:hypothetical protein
MGPPKTRPPLEAALRPRPEMDDWLDKQTGHSLLRLRLIELRPCSLALRLLGGLPFGHGVRGGSNVGSWVIRGCHWASLARGPGARLRSP